MSSYRRWERFPVGPVRAVLIEGQVSQMVENKSTYGTVNGTIRDHGDLSALIGQVTQNQIEISRPNWPIRDHDDRCDIICQPICVVHSQTYWPQHFRRTSRKVVSMTSTLQWSAPHSIVTRWPNI